MPVNVADLVATLRLDASGFADGAKKAQQQVQDLTAVTNRMVDATKQSQLNQWVKDHLVPIGEQSKVAAAGMVVLEKAGMAAEHSLVGLSGQGFGVASMFTALMTPTGLIVATFTSLAAAVGYAVHRFAEIGQEVRQLQAVSGLSAAQAEGLSDAFERLGLGSERLNTALFRLGQEIDSGGKNLDTFGVSIRTVSGDLREPGEVFREVRDRISEMSSTAEKSATIMKLFGRAGRELAPAFQVSREEFDHLAESGWNAEKQARAEEFIKRMGAMKVAFKDLAEETGAAVFKVVDFIKELGNLPSVAAVGGVLKKIGDEIGKTFSQGALIGRISGQAGMNETQAGVLGLTSPILRFLMGDVEQSTAKVTESMERVIKQSVDRLNKSTASLKDLRPFELQVRLADYSETLAQTRRATADQEAIIQGALSTQKITERGALDARLELLNTERTAVQKFYADKIADLENASDKDRVAIQQAKTEQLNALSAIQVKFRELITLRELAAQTLFARAAAAGASIAPGQDPSALANNIRTAAAALRDAATVWFQVQQASSRSKGPQDVFAPFVGGGPSAGIGNIMGRGAPGAGIGDALSNAGAPARIAAIEKEMEAWNQTASAIDTYNMAVRAQQKEDLRPRLFEAEEAIRKVKLEARDYAQALEIAKERGVDFNTIQQEETRMAAALQEKVSGMLETFKTAPGAVDMINKSLGALLFSGGFTRMVTEQASPVAALLAELQSITTSSSSGATSLNSIKVATDAVGDSAGKAVGPLSTLQTTIVGIRTDSISTAAALRDLATAMAGALAARRAAAAAPVEPIAVPEPVDTTGGF